MAGAGGDEVLDGIDGLDAAAGAEGGAVKGGGGTGEIELALQGPALQKSVDEAGVKNVSGAGSVYRLDAECWCVVEARAVPGDDTFFAHCGSSEAAPKSLPESGQGLAQIGFFHQPAGNVPAGDEVVDALQEGFHAGVEFIYVGDDGNAGGARPACGGGCGGGIVSIHVKSSGVDDPVPL